MKNLWIAGLLFIFACGSNESEETGNGVTISGEVNYPLEGLITLEFNDGQSVAIKDTIELQDDNTFSINVPSEEPLFYRINFYDRQAVNLIVDQSDIDVHVDGNNPQGFVQIEGSKDTEYLNEVGDMVNKFQESITPLRQQFVQARQSGDMDRLRGVQAEMETASKEAIEEVKAKITEMDNSIAAILTANYIFSDENFDFLNQLAKKFQEERPNSIYTRDFTVRVNELKKLAVGQPAPDFSLPTPDGDMVSLSSYKGKYVLVDFWAKWCKPCRIENPNVVRVYNRFHDKGFDVLGVSLDRSKEDWLRAIEEDGLTWTHVSDLKYWSSEIVKLYGIKGIPFAILVDPEGKIIAKNLRGEALERKLEEVLL